MRGSVGQFSGRRTKPKVKVIFRTASSGLRRRGVPFQTQFGSDLLHRVDAEGDVLVEINAEVSGAVDDVVAADASGKRLVFHAAADGLRLQRMDRLVGTHQRRRGDETGKLVA